MLSFIAFQQQVITALSELRINIEDIIEEQKQQRKMLFRIIHQKSGQSNIIPESMRPDIKLPVKSLDELEELEGKLKEKEALAFMVSN